MSPAVATGYAVGPGTAGDGATPLIVVSHAWRKVKVDRDACCACNLTSKNIVRIILDGTVIETRQVRKATDISVSAALDVQRDGHTRFFSIRSMVGDSTAAWRNFLDDLMPAS